MSIHTDMNPERLRLTEEVRNKLAAHLDALESSLPEEAQDHLRQVRENIEYYLDWNENDAMPVRQNMALRNDETGERR